MMSEVKRRRKIRVAMVAPPFGENGGPEVVVQNLTKALNDLGANVTLFAPGDWEVGINHEVTIKKSLWNMDGFEKQDEKVRRNYIISTQVAVLSNQNAFDLIHLHSQRYAFSVARNSKIPCLLSFHNKITEPIFNQLKETAIKTVALSKFQKGKIKVDAVIYNGVPAEEIAPSFEPGKYLIAVGRLDEQKGIDLAIKLALRSGKKLVILGRVGNSPKRQEYFDKKIKPFLDGKKIAFKGQVSHREALKWMREAEALLFTIRRPEVCPMVVGEALACGTPVIGTCVQPLPEMLRSRKVAFLSNKNDDLVRAIQNADKFDRRECRRYALENFNSLEMAKKYLALYKEIVKKEHENT